MTDLAQRIVDAMNAIHGVHPGARAVHAKGWCCRGRFTATTEGARVCVAEHFGGHDVPVTVRFSNGSGKPQRADGAKDERGMAVKFHLSGGRATDIVALTLPAFFVRTPEDFLAFLDSQRPDPATGKPDLTRVAAFVDEHPETQVAVGFAAFSLAPASYAGCTFNGIHAFRLTGRDGTQRFARYRWRPEAEAATLTDEETRALGREYLREDLESRLAEGPIRFELELQLAGDGDDPTDPTQPWPDDRDRIAAGTLEITEFAGKECEEMIFDPGRVVDGIERSDDPILHMRSPAYSVSFERRSKET